MIVFLVPITIGIAIVLLGINNMKGNINSIHWYHRQRVSEENKTIFSKLMGIGTIVCGLSVIIFGSLSILSELTAQSIFMTIGSYLTIIFLVVGVGIFIYATIKYNKGIF